MLCYNFLVSEYSKYRYNTSAFKSRRYLSSFLDHLTCFILTVLFLFVTHAIFEATPMVKNKKEEIQEAQYQLNVIVRDSKLDIFDDTTYNLVGSEKITSSYIEKLVKTSLIKEGYEDISSYYNNIDEISKENDNLYYYQLTYKNKNISNYNETSSVDISSYISKLEEKTSIKFKVVDSYPYLTLDDARKIDLYIRSDSTTDAKDLYNKLYSGYYSYLKESIDEITNKYKPYINQYHLYEVYSNEVFYYRHYELLIAYILSILIVYLLLPIIFKDGITLSMKVLKQAIVYKNKKKYSVYTDLLRIAYNMFKNVLTLPLIFLIMYSTSARTLFVSSLIFNIPLIYYPIFSLIIIIVSYVLSLFKGCNNEMLDEIMFRYNIVDITSFEIKNEENSNV